MVSTRTHVARDIEPQLEPPRRKRRHSPRRRWSIRGLLLRFVLGVVLVCFLVVAVGAGVTAALPSVGNAFTLATNVDRTHNDVVGGAVPTKLADAVVATEDAHFRDGFVVDTAWGAGRAALAVLRSSPGDPGGATIPEQLAKLLYVQGNGIWGHVEEVLLAAKLDVRWSHSRVLQMYLDAAYLGHRYWGYEAASMGYFGKPASQLDWAQASLLAGLLQAPSAYDPVDHPALAKQRQAIVLHRLVVTGFLSQAQATRVAASPWNLMPQVSG